MSYLRIIGIVISTLVLGLAFDQFRRNRIRRLDFLFVLISMVPVFAVSVDPNLANILLSILSLKAKEHSRIIAILIFSNVFLWVAVLILRLRISRRDRRFDLLIRALGIEDFRRSYDGKDVIKPVTVVIPALNEAENIGDVLRRVPARIDGFEVGALVIDDGSTDNTREAVCDSGYPVVRNKIRRGGGAALRLGYDIARENGAKVIVTMDADGQHRPEEIERLVRPIIEKKADIVIGSRILGKYEKSSTARYVGIHLFNRVINFMANTKISDCSNGFRAFDTEKLSSIVLLQDQFHTAELIIDASKKGLRISEAPITVLKRKSGASKKGKDWRYGFNFARTIMKTWWR